MRNREHVPEEAQLFDATAAASEQPTSDTAETDQAQEASLLARFRRFADSRIGFLLKLGTALTVTYEAVGKVLPEISRAQHAIADEKRWTELQTVDASIERPKVHMLSEATPEERMKIFQIRDKEFRLALDEACQAIETQLPPKMAAETITKLRGVLADYQVSTVDQALMDMGIPVDVQRPFPVIRVASRFVGEGTKATNGKLDVRGSQGMFEQPGFSTDADTLMVRLQNDPRDIRDTFQHEEVHWRLSGLEAKEEMSDPVATAHGETRTMAEGMAEYVNKQLARHFEGKPRPHPNYDSYVWSVDRIIGALGPERFWHAMAMGGQSAVRRELDLEKGPGMASFMLSDHGGATSRMFGENLDDAFATMQRLHAHGMWNRGDIQDASERLALGVSLLENAVLQTSDHRPIGYIMPTEDGLDVCIDVMGQRQHYTDEVGIAGHPLNKLPDVAAAWNKFRPVVSMDMPDSEKQQRFLAFRDSVEAMIVHEVQTK